MRILVTGFEPFGKETMNPSLEAVKRLPDTIAGAPLVKLGLPTVFSKSSLLLEEFIKEHNPNVVISVGQAQSRSCVTVERVAINLAEARIPDNEGYQPQGEPLQPEGDTAYFATIPVKAIVENIRNHKIPCQLSYTAGTYVCNSVMYQALYLSAVKYPNIRAGFIHVPYVAEQVVDKPGGTPFMSLEQIVDSLIYAVEATVKHTKDISFTTGETQ